MNKWLYLLGAILAEVTATSALKATDSFRRLWPSVVVIVGYALSFYLVSLTLEDIPVGVAYAIWSGLGLTLITLVASVLYDQRLDAPAIIGMSLILAGIVVMNVFSKSIAR